MAGSRYQNCGYTNYKNTEIGTGDETIRKCKHERNLDKKT